MKQTSCDALMPVLTPERLVQLHHLLALLPGAGYLSEGPFFLDKSNNMLLTEGVFVVTYYNHSQLFSFCDCVLSAINALIIQKVGT